MYWYKTGIAHIEAASGGLEAGTNILVPAPAMGDPDQGVCPLRKPSTGEYAPLHSADEGAADLIESFRIAGTDDRFRGGYRRANQEFHPGDSRYLCIEPDRSPRDRQKILQQGSDQLRRGFFRGGDVPFPPTGQVLRELHLHASWVPQARSPVPVPFILTAKLKKIDGIGYSLINRESSDEKTPSLLRQVLAGMSEVKTGENANSFRSPGIRGGAMSGRSTRSPGVRLLSFLLAEGSPDHCSSPMHRNNVQAGRVFCTKGRERS